jgi:hypothetical protein
MKIMNDKSGFPLSGVNRQLSFAIALIFMNSEGPSIRIDNPRRQLGNNDGFDHVVRVWPESTVSRLSTDAPRFVDALHICAHWRLQYLYSFLLRNQTSDFKIDPFRFSPSNMVAAVTRLAWRRLP